MSTHHTAETVSATFAWLVDELRQWVTTLEIELAHMEHAHATSADDADASPPAAHADRPGRATGTAGGADE